MDLLVPEDHPLDAGTKQKHTGHVWAVIDQESRGIFLQWKHYENICRHGCSFDETWQDFINLSLLR